MNDAQLALLSNMAYLDSPSKFRKPGATLGDLVSYHASEYGESEEYQDTFRAIMADPFMRELKIAGFADHEYFTGNGLYAYCFETSDHQAVFAFRGTGGLTSSGDWLNDAQLAFNVDATSQQRSALRFVKNTQARNHYDSVYATGHSLGGNLAQYVTLYEDSIDKCTVFNSAGFSPAFLLAHDREIAKNTHKITHYVENWDPLNNIQKLGLVSLGTDKTVFADGVFLHNGHAMRNFVSEFNKQGAYEQPAAAGGGAMDSLEAAAVAAGFRAAAGGVGAAVGALVAGGMAAGVAAGLVAGAAAGGGARRIKARPAELFSLAQQISLLHGKLLDLKTRLQSSAGNLHWQVAGKPEIEVRLAGAVRSLDRQCEKLEQYAKLVQTVCDRLVSADNALSRQCKDLCYRMDQITARSAVMPAPFPQIGYPPPIPLPNVRPVETADLTLLSRLVRFHEP